MRPQHLESGRRRKRPSTRWRTPELMLFPRVGDSLGLGMSGLGSGLAALGQAATSCPAEWAQEGVGQEAGLGDSSIQLRGLFCDWALRSLSGSLGPGPHFWELCPCWVSCSGPQLLPGTGGLSLKCGISLAGSPSPAARPGVWAADPLLLPATRHSWGSHLPGSPPAALSTR